MVKIKEEVVEQLQALRNLASDYIQGFNYDEVSDLDIIRSASDLFNENIDALIYDDEVYDIFVQCTMFVDNDFDHILTLEERILLPMQLVADLVKVLDGFLNN